MKLFLKLMFCIFLPIHLLYAQSVHKEQTAIFAGGCFWCMQSPFDKLDGVISTRVGYTGGKLSNPTYKQVASGKTSHIEAVEVTYNPQTISYEALLKVFWRNIDPFDAKGQFCDKGPHYTSAIFTQNSSNKKVALQSKQSIQKEFKDTIQTKILDASIFYDAEEYHQNYYKKNPIRYKYYRFGCGRDKRLEEIWGKS